MYSTIYLIYLFNKFLTLIKNIKLKLNLINFIRIQFFFHMVLAKSLSDSVIIINIHIHV